MRAQLIGKKEIQGFATLEILIAFAVIILSISAVILVVFGNQSMAVDLQTNLEAIAKAQTLLEKTRALSRKDFNLVSSVAPLETPPDIFKESLNVLDIGQCKKLVTSKISWNTESKTGIIKFSTFLSDIAGALKLGNDCDSSSAGNWDNPSVATSANIGGEGATDIDVRNNFIYLTSSPGVPAKEDFFVYEFDSVALRLIERGKIDAGKGLNKLDAVNQYVFAVNNDTSNHLMVFNVSNPLSPTLISSASLPNMTVGIGRSIFYYNNFVYVGTQYLACVSCPPQKNNEFHIFDVSNPAIPLWGGSFNVNHNINDIVVRGNYAYLATSDDNGEVRIYNISDLTNILFKGLFDAPGNEDGESLYLLGNKLYLGRNRTPSSRKDFYILDISNPTNPALLGSKNLGLSTGAKVSGIVVKENLAFVALENPTSGLQILNISDPQNIVNHSVCTTLTFSENGAAIDMNADFVFSANKSGNAIRVIGDQTSTCL